MFLLLLFISNAAVAQSNVAPFSIEQVVQSVAVLSINDGSSCTATYLGEYNGKQLALTNSHCIGNESDCRNTRILFLNLQGEIESQHRCTGILVTKEPEILDFTLFTVNGDLWQRDPIKIKQLSSQELSVGLEVYPLVYTFQNLTDGQVPPRLDFFKCFAKVENDSSFYKEWLITDPAYDQRPCALKKGNSGSPVFNSEGELIGIESKIHMVKGDFAIPGLNRFVFGRNIIVQINAIWPHIKRFLV